MNASPMREAALAAARMLQTEPLRLPVCPRVFFARHGWQLLSFREARARLRDADGITAVSEDGVTFLLEPDTTLTLYNDEQSPARVRFTLAHELGHLALNHFRRHDLSDDMKEAQADRFAANLIAPAAIAAEAIDAEDAKLLFGMSPLAWKKRQAELADDLHCLTPELLICQRNSLRQDLWRRRCLLCGGVYLRSKQQSGCPYCGGTVAERADRHPLGLPCPWTAEGWRAAAKNRPLEGLENPMVQSEWCGL